MLLTPQPRPIKGQLDFLSGLVLEGARRPSALQRLWLDEMGKLGMRGETPVIPFCFWDVVMAFLRILMNFRQFVFFFVRLMIFLWFAFFETDMTLLLVELSSDHPYPTGVNKPQEDYIEPDGLNVFFNQLVNKQVSGKPRG